MLSTALLPLLLGMQAVPPPPPPPPPPPRFIPAPPVQPGIYTNEEQVYFEREAGRTPPPWTGVRIEWRPDRSVAHPIDEFGTVIGPEVQVPPYYDQGPTIAGSMIVGFTLPVGYATIRLNRARPFTCWVSVRRHADRANGEADWSFDRGLAIHDQGGRVLVQPDGAPPVIIRMRNVRWPPPSTNRPSLVLYVHRPETPDVAESYSWADPDARMVGINLRWMQASCTRTEANS